MSDYDENHDTNDEQSGDSSSRSKDAGMITYDDGRDRSLSSRDAERQKLQQDMERYLTSGGQIKQIDRNVRMDPPRRPESNYGSRPI
ncbi:hypothetical protein FT643_18000 [Ketobacter sp. MCCC 1A13808]|uniref:hypothetical protein n=1 Tax=Ketobacter sp. MCCC 1A13808 TaxID=2602738 RepID=UPI000F19FB78|nr:hypothetical protein [Ketobacter sp. MCCC 1A13808]MVF14034.1 hypothetical protein [Ketobacter sp. MCCC 1A13808]RLP55064.1 MAG: hypothetical protein D6160_07460 [Ketobacter sp.]